VADSTLADAIAAGNKVIARWGSAINGKYTLGGGGTVVVGGYGNGISTRISCGIGLSSVSGVPDVAAKTAAWV
jgi:hypothetical protein